MGYQIGNSAPPFGLCLVQAGLRLALDALRHTSLQCMRQLSLAASCACPSMVSGSSLILFQLHSIIVATVRGMNHSSSKRMRVLVWILLISPLVVYVTVLSMTFIMVAQDKSLLQRDQTFYFCNINDEVGIWTSSIIVFLCALAFITYEIYTIVILWKNSQTFRAMNPHSRDRIFRSIVIRIGVFTVFPVIALFLSVILSFSAADSWTPSSGMRINVVDASLPLACALIFGSQEDLLNVWMFWRESSPYRSTQHSQTHSSGPEHLRTGGRSRILLDPVVPRVGVKVSTTRIQDRDDGWASKSPVESDIELHKDHLHDRVCDVYIDTQVSTLRKKVTGSPSNPTSVFGRSGIEHFFAFSIRTPSHLLHSGPPSPSYSCHNSSPLTFAR
ncbi:hypothetical protein F5877DRAFT_80285 [Lentinula edodes]|nr:hypothetical protein F5877DRAFT_80285 [Lentinula edodes]